MIDFLLLSSVFVTYSQKILIKILFHKSLSCALSFSNSLGKEQLGYTGRVLAIVRVSIVCLHDW